MQNRFPGYLGTSYKKKISTRHRNDLISTKIFVQKRKLWKVHTFRASCLISLARQMVIVGVGVTFSAIPLEIVLEVAKRCAVRV